MDTPEPNPKPPPSKPNGPFFSFTDYFHRLDPLAPQMPIFHLSTETQPEINVFLESLIQKINNDPVVEPPTSQEIQDLFYGTFLLTETKKPTASCPVFNCVHLDIQDPGIVSLDGALQHLTKKELSGQILLNNLPPVLIFHLCRFGHSPNQTSRCTRSISYPKTIGLLDDCLNNKISGKNISSTQCFKLIAVVSHHGSSFESGYYTCDILQNTDNKWYHCHDDRVSGISQVDVFKNPNAFVLIYQELKR